jgi:shikimate 5-dehydrogenase
VYALSTLGLSPIFLINRDEEEVKMVVDSFKSTVLSGLELIHLRSPADVDRYLGDGQTQGEKPGLAMVVGAIPAIAPLTPAERLVYTTVTHLLTIPYTLPTLHPTTDPSSLPLPRRRIFLDMAYKPRLTPMLRIASALGWQDVGGVQAMIEQGLAQQRMWKAGDASDAVASGDGLSQDVEDKARELIENMKDVVVVGPEVDRSLASA